MYINPAHYYIPKVSFILAYLCNPIFIYLILYDKKSQLGNYRYLLLFFAIFNMTCSLADLLIPMCVHDHRYEFVVFIADGPFSSLSDIGQIAISIRCGFISCTYGILNVHFVYRYLVLTNSRILDQYFLPYGLILSVLYCLLHLAVWALTCHLFLHPSPEMRMYVKDSFKEVYDGDIMEINFLSALYQEASEDIIERSWIGILLLTAISSYSIVLYFVIGTKIVKGLNDHLHTSERTNQMQRQLFKALTVQTAIPILVSFSPCIASFYGAAFLINFPKWVYWVSSVAISMFPFMDPLAITFFLPSLRHRLEQRIGLRPAPSSST